MRRYSCTLFIVSPGAIHEALRTCTMSVLYLPYCCTVSTRAISRAISRSIYRSCRRFALCHGEENLCLNRFCSVPPLLVCYAVFVLRFSRLLPSFIPSLVLVAVGRRGSGRWMNQRMASTSCKSLESARYGSVSIITFL